jgi:hypothetical protein
LGFNTTSLLPSPAGKRTKLYFLTKNSGGSDRSGPLFSFKRCCGKSSSDSESSPPRSAFLGCGCSKATKDKEEDDDDDAEEEEEEEDEDDDDDDDDDEKEL